MAPATEARSITPPAQPLAVKPGGSASVVFLVFAIAVTIFIVIAAFSLSPFLLFILVPIVPGFILVLMYRQKGFVNVTADGIDLSGFRGKIAKHVNYSDISQVVLAKRFTLTITMTNVGYAVVFLDQNGDQLFFLWDYQYSKDSLNTLFALFAPVDTARYDDVVGPNDLKAGVLQRHDASRLDPGGSKS